MSAAPMLSLEDVTVQFGGLVANDAVSLQVETNSIAALIGPNGAGKTTLFNVVTGALAPSHGTIVYRGRDITRSSRMQRGRLGIARFSQHAQEQGIGLRLDAQGLVDAREIAPHRLERIGMDLEVLLGRQPEEPDDVDRRLDQHLLIRNGQAVGFDAEIRRPLDRLFTEFMFYLYQS